MLHEGVDLTPAQIALVAQMIRIGKRRLNSRPKPVEFETGIPRAEALLNDIEGHPHLYVIACVMDRQIPSGRAWLVPYRVGQEIGGFTFDRFVKLKRDEILELFTSNRFHRFNNVMAGHFHSAVVDIQSKYQGDASRIWANRPSSATVIRRFLEFGGVGLKIANMGANILVRGFKVPMTEYSSIDISPDVQVRRYFVHHGLLRPEAGIEELIYRARELHPRFPGILDIAAFEGGRLQRRVRHGGNDG